MENHQAIPNHTPQSISLRNKQHEDQQQAEEYATKNGATVGHGLIYRRLPAELLCEMAKWLPWKVPQQKQQLGDGKNIWEKEKNYADLLLANYALTTFLGNRFRQFRAMHKKITMWKKRTFLSREQQQVPIGRMLEDFFGSYKFITKNQKIYLASATRLTMTQVSTWFANRRRRWRREQQQQNNNNQA